MSPSTMIRQASSNVRILLFVGALSLAAALRFYGISWDQGQYLHPDERFLTMVVNDSQMPSSIAEYLDPKRSPLNPNNTKYQFFVYGTLPTTLNKAIGWALGLEAWHHIGLLGRSLSALFDIGTLILIFFLCVQFEALSRISPNIKYLAITLYAICVFPIQQAHFFTVDSFTVFFSILALMLSLKFHNSLNPLCAAGAGISLGAGLGCKISAVYLLPLLITLIIAPRDPLYGLWRTFKEETLIRITGLVALLLCCYLTLRISDPHFFESADWYDPSLNKNFLKNIDELRSMSSYSPHPFPPGVQWLSKTPIIFPLYNIIFFGLGPILSLLVIAGSLRIKNHHSLAVLAIAGWGSLFFLYQASQFSHTMRYFYVLYPLLVILGAIGLEAFWQKITTQTLTKVVLLLAIILWPISFMRIYTYPHSRVTASRWIYQNIPARSVIAGEHWDDGLPLSFPGSSSSSYEMLQMPVFAQDDQQKWREMSEALKKADYIVFSSNRGYGTIMPIPKTYPQTSAWYRDLFDGKLEFQKIAEFESLPGIRLGSWDLAIDTQLAEEAFSVYDHPKVTIFRKK